LWAASNRFGRLTQRPDHVPLGDGVVEQRLTCAIALAIHAVRMRSRLGRNHVREALTMARYERGLNRPTLATLVEILDGYGSTFQSFGGAFVTARKRVAQMSTAELTEYMLDQVK